MKFNKLVKYIVPLFAFAIVCRSVEVISFIYYLVPVLCILFIVLVFFKSTISSPNQAKKKSSSNILHHPLSIVILPGIWFLLTALWSAYPDISAARALYYILLSTGCISAGILWSQYFGKNILDFLLPSNVFVVLLCLFSIITGIPSDSWTGGNSQGFMGFFGHQNLLASIILFTIPSVFELKIKDQSKMLKVFFFILFSLNLLVLLLTYSRASLLALIVGIVVFLILNKNWRLLISGFVVVVIFSLMIFFIPSLNQQAEIIIKKNFPELSTTRIFMWEASYRAALDGGLTGLGYGISDPDEKYGGKGDHYEGERFIREKGNSSLALIEETGLIGLILFLFPVFYILFRVVIGKDALQTTHLSAFGGLLTTNYSLLTAALTAFFLHSQFEAWWVGVGSVQLPLFFIYLGLAFKLSSSNEIKSN